MKLYKYITLVSIALVLSVSANARTIRTTKGDFKRARFTGINMKFGFLIKHSEGQTWVHLHELERRSDRNLFLLADVQLTDGTVYSTCTIYSITPTAIKMCLPFTHDKTKVIVSVPQEKLNAWWRYKLGYSKKKAKGRHDAR